MIRKLVDFALENPFIVLAGALLLLAWGAISFHQLPVEAYPDVANNYVEVITQWPGDFGGTNRAAGDDSAGSGDERHSACGALAIVFAVRALGSETDFR